METKRGWGGSGGDKSKQKNTRRSGRVQDGYGTGGGWEGLTQLPSAELCPCKARVSAVISSCLLEAL